MDVVSLEQKKKKNILKLLVQTITNGTILVVMALFVFLYLAQPVRMKGHSMEPTVVSDGTVLMSRLKYCILPPQQFDVVVCHYNGSEEMQIKRIVAVPGDRICIRDGNILINGAVCEAAKAYIHDLTTAGQAEEEITLGEAEYFVMGDYASYSEDSRSRDVGVIHRDQIIGNAWLSIEEIFSFRWL